MTIKNIKIIPLIVVFLFNIQFSYSIESLLPKKKPNLTSEVLQKKITKNFLIPQKKPITLKTKDKHKEKKITKIGGIIIPKNKPLIVRKQTSRIAKKSKYYSDRDYAYAKQAVKFMEKSN